MAGKPLSPVPRGIKVWEAHGSVRCEGARTLGLGFSFSFKIPMASVAHVSSPESCNSLLDSCESSLRWVVTRRRYQTLPLRCGRLRYMLMSLPCWSTNMMFRRPHLPASAMASASQRLLPVDTREGSRPWANWVAAVSVGMFAGALIAATTAAPASSLYSTVAQPVASTATTTTNQAVYGRMPTVYSGARVNHVAPAAVSAGAGIPVEVLQMKQAPVSGLSLPLAASAVVLRDLQLLQAATGPISCSPRTTAGRGGPSNRRQKREVVDGAG